MAIWVISWVKLKSVRAHNVMTVATWLPFWKQENDYGKLWISWITFFFVLVWVPFVRWHTLTLRNLTSLCICQYSEGRSATPCKTKNNVKQLTMINAQWKSDIFVRSLVLLRSFFPSFFHLFFHSLLRSLAHSFIRSFVRSFRQSFARSLAHSLIRSFFQSIVCSFARSLICLFVRSFSRKLARSFVRFVNHLFSRSLAHSFVRSVNRSFVRSLAYLCACSFSRSLAHSLVRSLVRSFAITSHSMHMLTTFPSSTRSSSSSLSVELSAGSDGILNKVDRRLCKFCLLLRLTIKANE